MGVEVGLGDVITGLAEGVVLGGFCAAGRGSRSVWQADPTRMNIRDIVSQKAAVNRMDMVS